MKKTDIAILILIVGVSLLVAFLLGKALFGGRVADPVQVETAEAISAEVTQPDKSIFNEHAINPSVEIQIGQSSNEQPFGN
ncbi:MAG TPA: hypothetical protein VFG56_02855 [Candidatus Saccharimonadales bacterium]|nr:hypothetical protein [Candidatus Saccharimonadales bacterium]